jgi:adenine-specific DNA-methyltransferase
MVYKQYELTYDEVKVIDPEFSLTEKEYTAIKVN